MFACEANIGFTIGLEGRMGRYAARLGPKNANQSKRLTLVGFFGASEAPQSPIDIPYCGRGPFMPSLGASPVWCTSLDR